MMTLRSRRVRSVSLLSFVFLMGLWVSGSEADTITFADSFEGSATDPFWTVIQQNGTVSLSTAQAHT